MHEKIQTAVTQIRTSIPELAFQILFVFIAPIILINIGVFPITYRVIILAALVTILSIVLIAERWTLGMLGFSRRIPLRAVLAYLGFTVGGIALIALAGERIGNELQTHWWQQKHFLYVFFVVSAFQEIAYRSYLIPALAKIESSPIAVILTNAALFTFLHSIFPNYLINLPLAFIGGVGFAWIYIKHPYTILIILSHAALNFAAVWYGFFTIG